MGIDANILVRNVPAEIVTDEWLKEQSWRLVRAIGAEHFFLSDGLTPSEYAVASKKWHADFEAHPNYPEYQSAGKADKWPGCTQESGNRWRAARAAIVADIGEAPKDRQLAIERTLTRYRDDDSPPAGSEYHEDSDKPIVAKAGECLLELSIFGRYYGESYERGDILTYCAMAEWLEINIPGCEVWYGGDSSGMLAEPFHDARRRELRRHLFSSKGRAYFESSFGRRDEFGLPAACSLCPGGVYRGNRFGSGQTFASFSCAGCGKSVETHDSGATWQEQKESN